MNNKMTYPLPPTDFDPLSQQGLQDPAAICQRAREETPVFFYPPLGVWMVTRRDDAERVLTEWEVFSNRANKPQVPEQFWDRFPPSVIEYSMVAIDPPIHTEARTVVQRSFMKQNIDPLGPVIADRAREILDGFEGIDNIDIMNTYCLELTTRTLLALYDIPDADRGIFERARDAAIKVLASAFEPMQEPDKTNVWEDYISGYEYYYRLTEQRRNSTARDIVSTMASQKNSQGGPLLSTERIALHLAEISFAGTDTTAQAMANAITFLDANPRALEAARKDPSLWANVMEETVRRRPSAPFAGRMTTRDVEINGVHIPAGQPVWISLAAANTDPRTTGCPMGFDIERAAPADHLSFTKGRHTCPGAPLARLQGAVGLRSLYERLPNLRVTPGQPLDFAPIALLPIRLSLKVEW